MKGIVLAGGSGTRLSPINPGCEISQRQSRVKACQRDKNVKHKLKYT